MTGNYQAVKWIFWGAWISSFILVWLSLVVLKPIARNLWTAFAGLGFGLGLMAAYLYFCKPLTISPDTVEFGDFKLGNERHEFLVDNKSGRDIYTIQVALNTTTNPDDPAKYDYDLAAGSRKPIFPGSDFADTITLACTYEKKSGDLLVFQIFHMQPNERRELVLIEKTTGKSLVTSSITSFTYKQPPAVSDPHTMAQHFAYPEHVTCLSTTWPADGSVRKDKVTSTITPDEEGK
jgi:hypothetical protein